MTKDGCPPEDEYGFDFDFDDDDDCQLPELPPLSELVVGRMITEPPAWALNRPDIGALLKKTPGRVRPALTGGVASGKSSVAALFMELGAGQIDFDLLARRAVEPESPGFQAAVELLGRQAVAADGSLDRRLIGRLVFEDAALKTALENIIHPRTWELMAEELAALAEKPVVLVSIPLLFEAGLETFFDPVITVFTHPDLQLSRLMARNPDLGEEGARKIIDNQWPPPPKVMGATFVINNNGPLSETGRQVEAVWESLAASKNGHI